MAYTTGVSGSIADLLVAVRAFAVSNAGFTDHWANRWVFSSGGTTYDMFQMSKNGVYYTFQYTSSVLNLSTATAPGTSGSLTGQPGANATYYASIRQFQGPHIAYWLFNGGYSGTGPCVHVVVEVVNGVFFHFSFGEIEKQGSYSGGQYVTGTYHATSASFYSNPLSGYNTVPWSGFSNSPNLGGHIRFPSGAGTECAAWGAASGANRVASGSWTSNNAGAGDGMDVTRYCYNTFNNRAPLIPIEVLCSNNTVSAGYDLWIPMGNVAGAASVNTRNIDPKQVMLTDWQVFPVFEKNGDGISYVTGQYLGLAYRR